MNRARFFALGLSLALLAGCDRDSEFADLLLYLEQARAKPKGTIEPLPAFLPYEVFTYSAAALRHPFQPSMTVELTRRQESAKQIQPDETRTKQLLEAFNIENFTMVGTLANDDGVYALVRGGNGVHRVKAGDYLGRNHGRIVDIGETGIDVLEIVPDGEGGWLERPRSLTLEERS